MPPMTRHCIEGVQREEEAGVLMEKNEKGFREERRLNEKCEIHARDVRGWREEGVLGVNLCDE